MYGVRPTAWIMTGIMLVEAWPLALIALAPNGMAKLAMLLGYHAPPIGMVAWASGLIVALAYAALSMTSLPFIRSHLFDVAALKLLALPFAFITGLFEELFFRKWIMNALAAQGAGVPVQIAVSGLGFGVAHAACSAAISRPPRNRCSTPAGWASSWLSPISSLAASLRPAPGPTSSSTSSSSRG